MIRLNVCHKWDEKVCLILKNVLNANREIKRDKMDHKISFGV